MKHATWNEPRGEITVLRFDFGTLAKFYNKRHTLISRTLHGVGCPPRTSLTPGRPVEKPAAFAARPVYRYSRTRFPVGPETGHINFLMLTTLYHFLLFDANPPQLIYPLRGLPK